GSGKLYCQWELSPGSGNALCILFPTKIDVVSKTNDVLPPSDDDSDDEVDVVGDLRVNNVIQNFEHEYSESEDSDLDNPLLLLPHPKPPDKEFDFEIVFQKEISVRRNAIVKFNAKVKFGAFNDKNDVLSYFMFVIFAKSFLYSSLRVRTRFLILVSPNRSSDSRCSDFP
nr:hypothetical protein [Tanacetum cinerariifolium]